MSATYINLGTSCLEFSTETPTPEDLSGYYIIDITSAPATPRILDPKSFEATINNGFKLTSAGYITASGGGLRAEVNATDFEVKIWYDRDLTISGTPPARKLWRFVTDAATTTKPTTADIKNTITPVGTAPIVSTQADVNAQDENYGLAVYQSASNTGRSNIRLVRTSNMFAQTAMLTLIRPSDITGGGGAETVYLKRPNRNTYFSSDGNTIDLSVAGTAPGSVSGFKLVRTHLVVGAPGFSGGRILLSTPSSPLTPIGGQYAITRSTNTGTWQVTLTTDFQIGGGGVGSGDGASVTYDIVSTPPSSTYVVPFPTALSMFKNTTNGQYLYWNQSTGAAPTASFSFVDYWQSGLTANQIRQGLYYYLQDLSPATFANPEIYKWYVVTNLSGFNPASHPTGTSGKVANVYVASTTFTVGTPSSDLAEGWGLYGDGPSGSNYLAYFKAGNPIGYLNSSGAYTTLATQTLAGLTAVASSNKIYTCVKCTNVDATTQLCVP